MIIHSNIENFLYTHDSIVNWVNCKGKCIDELEMSLRNLYGQNYLFYIDKRPQLGEILYDGLYYVVYKKYILNTYLYNYYGEVLTEERVTDIIKKLINVCLRENINSIAIPPIKTFSDISKEKIENIIVNNFYTYAPDICVTLYQ